MTVSISLEESWRVHAASHSVKSRRDFSAGYDAGGLAERDKFVRLIEDNGETIRRFAGSRSDELLVYMLRNLRAD